MSLTVRQRCAAVLRKLWLLQLADHLFFVYLFFRQRKGNCDFRLNHPEVCTPPASILYDIQGNCDLAGFYQSGKLHAQEISKIITDEYPGKSLKILEWGCGPARVLQHLKSAESCSWELWGSDYNPRSISWCQQYLPGVHFIHNGLEPPIPIEREIFDVVYCISVFTHLSEERHYQWIAEINRLLKPGGLFIGTFHGETFRDYMTDEENRRIDRGELVIRDRIREGKKDFSAYHCDNFVRRLLVQFNTVKKLGEFAGFSQSVWTAKKGESVGS